MLDSLHIENIAVIEKADVSFSNGFTVLTGETGAGKSIIIDAINAVLGERTSKELIRTGCDKAVVTAVFSSVNKEVSDKLESLGFNRCDDEMIITRTLTSSKSISRINGENVTSFVLREIAPFLLNIHGQHDSDALFNSENHYKYIDLIAKNNNILEDYKLHFSEMLKTRKIVKTAEFDLEERERKLEILKYQIQEIEDANVKIGEKQLLEKRKNEILNSQKINESLNATLNFLSGDEAIENSGASELIESSCGEIASISSYSENISKVSDKLADLNFQLSEIKNSVQQLIENTEFNRKELEEVEQRLDMYYSFEGKYGTTEQDVLEFLTKSKNEYSKLNEMIINSDDARNLLPKQIELVKEKGKELSNSREVAAASFSEKVTNQLKFLDMANAKFLVSINKCAYSSNGADEIEFLISTNPGEPLKPLSKVASGGEMSRIMLAIKNVLAADDIVGTLIFDEIDTGISGIAAAKVADKLKETSSGKQVICVTHLAQIAAKSDTHLLISKDISNGRAITNVSELDFEQRKIELARIIGSAVTQANLMSAEEMLKNK